MKHGYIPEVGDRVRRDSWRNGDIWVDVEVVHRDVIIGVDDAGARFWASVDSSGWVKLEKPTPMPEAVINIYPNDVVFAYRNEADADSHATGVRIAKLFLFADGSTKVVRTEEAS